MGLFLFAVAVVAGLLSSALVPTFMNNPFLNTLILSVLGIGIIWNLLQVTRIGQEVRWVESFQRNRVSALSGKPPALMAPMASMLAAREQRGHTERLSLSAPAMRSLLDGISARLDESRELSRYMTGLLIFLGLLGTFWGLLQTVHAVADVIGGMSVGSGDINALFEQLKSGLQRPLAGMGTAFSASMFGLAGALVLGFLDLTAGQAQNRFYNELEEWLAGLTRLASGALGDGDAAVPVYVQAMLEQTAENLEDLQRILSRGEDGRVAATQALVQLTERLASLGETLRANQQLMLKLAEAQAVLAPSIRRLAEPVQDENAVGMRASLRNIEATFTRMIQEIELGRAQSTAELRQELRVLTRTVAALAETGPR
jgi:hypothetical protein